MVDKTFKNREDVLDWIINNQLGRRNITDFHKIYLRGLQYEREKKKETNSKGVNQHTKEVGVDNTHQPKTAERLAEIHKVDESTIRKDAQFAKAIDKISENLGEDISC